MTIDKMNSVVNKVAEILKEVENNLEVSKPYPDKAILKMGLFCVEFRRGWTGVADISISVMDEGGNDRYLGAIDLPNEAPVKKLVPLALQIIAMARHAYELGTLGARAVVLDVDHHINGYDDLVSANTNT